MQALNTAIFVQQEVDLWELYNVCLRQLLFFDGRDTGPADIRYVREDLEEDEYLGVDPHEELPAMLAIWYNPGGDVLTEERAKGKTGCSNKECEEHEAVPFHKLVGLATSVFYDDARGWNAGNLHSGMIYGIGAFLDSKKIQWKWQNNIENVVHEGYEDLEDLPVAVAKVRGMLTNPMGMGPNIAQQIRDGLMRAMGLKPEEDA